MYVSMPICLKLCFHMPMCLDLCSLHALCYLRRVRVLHAMFVCLDLGHFVMTCAIVSLLSLCLSFLYFGLLVRTRCRHYGLCHRPHTKAHIKEFGLPLFACLCLLVSMLHACVSLSGSRLCHVLRL